MKKTWRQTSHRPVTTPELERDIIAVVSGNPQVSLRKLAQQLATSKTSVYQVLKRLSFRPYKFHHAVELREGDWEKRLEYCEWYTATLGLQPTLTEDIIWSDEAVFYLHGGVNSKNEVYWSQGNPRVVKETHHSFNPKVLVWFGMHNTTLLGPYFFDGTVNAATYKELLTGFLTEYLETLDHLQRARTYFQQDGASAHFAKSVRSWLDTVFPNKWIGRSGTIPWSPRSPDLTPLDCFLWNRLKSVVYTPQPHSIQTLKDNIVFASRRIPLEQATNTYLDIIRRVYKCKEVGGRHFEHLL